MRLPDWIIVGAAKSGTTSLSAWLGRHPQVWAAPQKELHYFDRDVNFDRGPQWYAGCFAPAAPALRAGEATPNYLHHPAVPERLAALVPDARLIAVLRDPVNRAYSHYCHRLSWGAPLPGFDEVVRRALDGDPEVSHFLTRGDYDAQLSRWHAAGLSVHVHLFEELAQRPADVFSAVCGQLGIADLAPPNLGEVLNAAHRRRSDRVRGLMERTQLWQRLPRTARRLDGWNTALVQHPEMSDWARDRLAERFADGNRALALRVDRELQGWST